MLLRCARRCGTPPETVACLRLTGAFRWPPPLAAGNECGACCLYSLFGGVLYSAAGILGVPWRAPPPLP